MKLTANQPGFVLVTALILMLSITIVAAALLSVSGTDTKMISAAQESSEAAMFARGGNDETYADAVNRRFAVDPDDPASGTVNIFTETANFPRNINNTFDSTNTNISFNGLAVVTDCPASWGATNVATLGCNNFRVTTTSLFGDGNVNQIQVESAVSQQLRR